uniref:Uncharacterized protein n=1 Tax=Acrobeloides nanus TaxID=290746 RepID=A0A914CWM0_9BILA
MRVLVWTTHFFVALVNNTNACFRMNGIRLFLIPWFLPFFFLLNIHAQQQKVHDFFAHDNSHFQNIFHGPPGHFFDRFPAFEPFHLHPAFPVLHPSFGTHTGLGLLQPSSNSLAISPTKSPNIFRNPLSVDKANNFNQITTAPHLVPYETSSTPDSVVSETSKRVPPRARATLISINEETTTVALTPTEVTTIENNSETTTVINDITTTKIEEPTSSTVPFSLNTITSTEAVQKTTSTIPLSTTTAPTVLPILSTTIAEAGNETSESYGTGIITNNRTSNFYFNGTTESQVDLKQHLNNPELKNLLSSSNLSIEDAQVFLKLVEKVLEEEVAKRVKQQDNKEDVKVILNFSENSSLPEDSEAGNSNTKDAEEVIALGDPIQLTENIQEENRELKTVNTHLGFDSVEMEVLAESAGVPKLTLRTERKPLKIQAINSEPNVETVVTKVDEDPSLLEKLDLDYRDREQETFDRIVGAVNNRIPALTADNNLRHNIEYKKDPVPIRTLSYAAPRLQLPRDGTRVVPVDSKNGALAEFTSSQPLQRRKVFSNHKHPRTPFESLVKDYELRLSGQNGINDIIKALHFAMYIYVA